MAARVRYPYHRSAGLPYSRTSYKLLGTQEWFVIHHTDCGMQLSTNEVISTLLASSLETAKVDPNGWEGVGKGPGAPEGKFRWLFKMHSLFQPHPEMARDTLFLLIGIVGAPAMGNYYEEYIREFNEDVDRLLQSELLKGTARRTEE